MRAQRGATGRTCLTAHTGHRRRVVVRQSILTGFIGRQGNRGASTLIEYFGVDGRLLFSSFVPSSPGNASLSFFGIVFPDARVAGVRITSGDTAPGPNDDDKHDIVMMDDFLYGEPQAIQ